MDPITAIETIAGVIQLAVAPVFLLAGIAGMMNVLTTRLGRVVDRVRKVETRLKAEADADRMALLTREIRQLWRRIRLVNWSIRMFVTGALLISLVIVALFCGELIALDLSTTIAVLFVLAMCLVILGLLLFLFEISVATRHIDEDIATIVQR